MHWIKTYVTFAILSHAFIFIKKKHKSSNFKLLNIFRITDQSCHFRSIIWHNQKGGYASIQTNVNHITSYIFSNSASFLFLLLVSNVSFGLYLLALKVWMPFSNILLSSLNIPEIYTRVLFHDVNVLIKNNYNYDNNNSNNIHFVEIYEFLAMSMRVYTI